MRTTTPATAVDAAAADAARTTLVQNLRGAGIRDERVLAAMQAVPRHLFVPQASVADAYADRPLPIGDGQTISQPSLVAQMTEELHLKGGDRVLEIGTGSGYQAAILAAMGCEVYSIEILPQLAQVAEQRLRALGYDRVHVRSGDGYYGWPEAAPFDAVIVTAASPKVPPALVSQLKTGGTMLLPIGGPDSQALMRGEKGPRGVRLEAVNAVRFVPMTGAVRDPAKRK